MNLQPIPMFGIGDAGKSPNVDAQERINLYAEIQKDVQKSTLVLYPTPGLVQFLNLGSTPIRGMYNKGDSLYLVHKNTLYQVANDATTTVLGTLNSYSGRVAFADNGTEVMVVDGPDGYIYNTDTLAFAEITAAGFPGGDTVTFYNGRFVVNKPGTGQFYISGLYDGLSWDALEFATAESDPDQIVRVMADSGQLILFGDKTTEFWGDSGAVDFPYAKIGAAAIEWGLAARWSLTKFMDSLIFLRKNRLGQVQVCLLSGSSSVAVSTPDIDYQMAQFSGISNATGFAYMVSGHPFYQINFPSDNISFIYDGLTQAWSNVQYGTNARHRGEIQAQLVAKPYVSDWENGKLYRLSENVYTDDGAMIVREFTSRHLAAGDKTRISSIWLEMEGGVGISTGQGEVPQLMMQISKDGGHEWGPEVWRNIGEIGKYKTRAVFNRLGRARDWLFRFRVTDPVKTVFVAAWGRRS